ncbi:MAG: insulinase family protein [Gemmatimonadota bacterium]|nr:insulinase family protein [Gemmatimonadota bacterium]
MTATLLASQTRTLENGLRVVVHEDHTSPVVAVHLMYHVGSRHEQPGRTGLAHLLEHLLFEGTEHAPKGTFDDLLERAGGSNNGSTWLDRTCYHETVPTNAVELALWLERDRMVHFLPALNETILNTQRSVVINERLEAYDNRPYGLADERLHQMLFPPQHPYSWPTIGYQRDLEAITLADARDFYQRYYVPGNAALVLAGDLVSDRAFALAERFFGDLPSGPAVAQTPAGSPVSPVTRRASMADEVSFPRIYRAYTAPRFGTADWVALDVLAYLLADGESSRLQRALIRQGRLAQDVDTYLYPTEVASVFGIVATARSGVSPEELEATLDRVLCEVLERGVDHAELQGAVRRAQRDQIAELATVESRAEELAYATLVLGSPGALADMLGLYAAVTPEEVTRIGREYLIAERSATLTVVPVGEQRAQHAA